MLSLSFLMDGAAARTCGSAVTFLLDLTFPQMELTLPLPELRGPGTLGLLSAG